MEKIIAWRKKRYILLGIILLTGFVLRMWSLNKPDGFWYDEAVIYYQASQSFPLGIIDTTVNKDVHFPLYQLILNLWMHLFGTHDIIPRLFSVICGIFTIPVMYMIGKESDSKRTGVICALLTATNSLLIYYSQEVKFYSFLALLCGLSLLFLIRAIKKPSIKNYSGLILSNLGIIYTFTIGIVFVFIQLALGWLYIYKHSNKLPDNSQNKFLKHIGIMSICLIPFAFLLLKVLNADSQDFTGGFSSIYFDFSFLLVLLQNWFSPKLIGLINNPAYYHNDIFSDLSFNNFLALFIPFFLSFSALILSLKKNLSKYILSSAALFILFEILFSVFGQFKCMTRYTILVMPNIILLVSIGFSQIKNKIISTLLIVGLVSLNLHYIITSEYSAPKLQRPEGHKIPAVLIKRHQLNDKDIFIYPIREYLVDKYYPTKAQKISILKTFYKKENHLNSILSAKDISDLNYINSKSRFKNYILSDGYPAEFQNYVESEIIKKLKPGKHLVFVINKNFVFYTRQIRKQMTRNDVLYDKSSLIYMLLSKTTDDLLHIANNNLKLKAVEKVHPWVVIIFEKEN